MAQDDDRVLKVAAGIAAVGALLLGAALFWAMVRSAPQLLAWWVVLTFQVILAGLTIVVGFTVATWLLRETLAGLVGRLDRLERDHRKLLLALKRRTPALIATAALIGQAALLLADKSFDGEVAPTLIVSVMLLIAFWFANELQSRERLWLRVIGWTWWVAAVCYLPVAVMIFRGWGAGDLAVYLWSFSTSIRLFWGIATVLVLAAPAAIAVATRDT